MKKSKRRSARAKRRGFALTAEQRARWLRAAAIGLLAASVVGGAASLASSCGWDPRAPFERNAPEVDEAIRALDAGSFKSAEEELEHYLGTGACVDGGLAVADAIRKKPNGSFDLGLTLFYLAEHYGRRFGDEDLGDGGAGDDPEASQRSAEIDCALPIVKAIASDPSVPAEIRARAHYLAGNLDFMRRKYEDAVKSYDEALAIVPGLYEEAGGDGVGRDAAWNRAIALRRIQDQKDAGNDAADGSDGSDAADGSDGSDGADGSDGSDSGDDGGKDGGDDGGKDGGGDDGGKDGGGDDGGGDAGQDAGQDGGQDGGANPQQPPPQQPPPQQPPPQQDERMLDQLEEAPTYQEQEAKARAGARRGRAMEDK